MTGKTLQREIVYPGRQLKPAWLPLCKQCSASEPLIRAGSRAGEGRDLPPSTQLFALIAEDRDGERL